MYSVYIPSKKKPLKTFSELRCADFFARQGYNRYIFDNKGLQMNCGGVSGENLKEFLKRNFKK